ncbi:hypothetical protein ACHAWF_019046 [Thalassiosira exigua]
MTVEEIHRSDPRFSVYLLKNFQLNLKILRGKIEATREQVQFDNNVVAKHKQLFPRDNLTTRGYPHWNGHQAKEDLEDDVRDGTADKMPPRKLWATRNTYQEFPKAVFCKRVQAEKRKQREAKFWVEKRNRKSMMKYLKERAKLKKTRPLRARDAFCC